MRIKTFLAVLVSVFLWPSPALAVEASLHLVGPDGQSGHVNVHFRGEIGPPSIGCLLAESKVEFRWDGRFIHSAHPANCVIDFVAKPPAEKNIPGRHTISAIYQTKDGVKHTVKRTYVLDHPVLPGPKPKPKPKPSTKPAPTKSSLAPSPSMSALPPSPSASQSAPSPSDSPAVFNEVSKTDDATSWLPLGLGGMLVVFGGGMVFWLIRRSRHEQLDGAD